MNIEYDARHLTITGHAGYDEPGKDIVCAAVSSTYLCTVNAILSINESSIKLASDDNKNIITIISDDIIVDKLINNMLTCLKSLEEQYPKNIKIK